MANLTGVRPNNLNWKPLTCTLLLIFTYLLQILHFSKGQDGPHNVYCSPQTDIVPVDDHVDPKGDYRYFPYLIKLTRCHGSVGSAKPSVKKCVPQKETNVTFNVTNWTTRRTVQVIMRNHTACKGECVKGPNNCNKFQNWNEISCSCVCQHNSPTQSPCPQPLIHVWNQQRCDCVCPTGTPKCQDANKVWSGGESCRCICAQRFLNRCARKRKVLNEQNCKCEDYHLAVTGERFGDCVGSVKQGYVILIAVLEFLVLVVLFALFHKFCLQNENSKFYTMTGTIARMLPIPACRSNKENRNKPESIDQNDMQIIA